MNTLKEIELCIKGEVMEAKFLYYVLSELDIDIIVDEDIDVDEVREAIERALRYKRFSNSDVGDQYDVHVLRDINGSYSAYIEWAA